jgi:outer membrane protein insertion porin family
MKNFFVVCLLCAFALIFPAKLNGQALRDSATMKVLWKAKGEVTASDLRQIDGLGKNRAIRAGELEATIHRVLNNLQQRGYYFAQIDSVKINAPNAMVYLNSLPKVRLAAAVKPSAPVEINWRRELRGTNNEPDLQQRLNEIMADFARRGYPLASFTVDSVAVAEKELVTVHFNFNSGPLVQIDSILIRGNKLTKRAVLLRELPLKKGARFNLEQVQSIPERLQRLGYLQSVAPPQLAQDARGRYWLDVAVVEGNSNSLNGVAGYNPGEGNQKGFVSGLVDVKFGNLLGTGRQITVRWEKRSRQTQELALRYREPWVAGYPVHLSGGFRQLIQDTTYVERRWDFTAELPLGQNFTASGHVAQESVAPDSLARVRLNLPRSSVTSVGAALRYDSTDDPINPRRGIFYSTAVETGRKSAEQLGSVRKNFSRDKVLVDFQWLVPAFWPQVLSLAVHGRQVKSNAPPEILVTDQFRFGGATTLRGYREEQFRGARVAWGNLEYRYLLSRRTRAFIFLDAGYYSGFEYVDVSAPQLRQVENNISAWGFGVRVDTPLGIIGVDYGRGEGDALTNGKVHVSLVNSF